MDKDVVIENVEDLPADKLLQIAQQKNEEMQDEEARYFYELAYKKEPDNDIIVLCYSDFLKSDGKEKEAIKVLTNAIKRRPTGSYKRYFQLAELYNGVESIKKFEEGIAMAKSITIAQYNLFQPIKITEKELKRDLANAYAAVAEVCMTDLINVKEAEAKCIEALKLGAEMDPSSPDVLLQTANYLLFKDDTDAARERLLTIYNIFKKEEENNTNENNEEPENPEELKQQVARLLIEVQCYEEAAGILTILNETGKDQEILYNLAYCYFKQHKYATSSDFLDEYEQLVEKQEKDEQIAEAAVELRAELDKIDPKEFENSRKDETGDDEWMDIEDAQQQ